MHRLLDLHPWSPLSASLLPAGKPWTLGAGSPCHLLYRFGVPGNLRRSEKRALPLAGQLQALRRYPKYPESACWQLNAAVERRW